MDQLARFGEKLVDILVVGAGPTALVIFLVGCFFAYLYLREKARNQQLTDVILQNTEDHANKFVTVVTDGIEADNKLAVTISQLASTISDIKSRLDNLVDSSRPTHRR